MESSAKAPFETVMVLMCSQALYRARIQRAESKPLSPWLALREAKRKSELIGVYEQKQSGSTLVGIWKGDGPLVLTQQPLSGLNVYYPISTCVTVRSISE